MLKLKKSVRWTKTVVPSEPPKKEQPRPAYKALNAVAADSVLYGVKKFKPHWLKGVQPHKRLTMLANVALLLRDAERALNLTPK